LEAILDEAVARRGWRARLQAELAVRLWPSVAGPELARHTAALRVRGRTLHVAVRSGAWATQLSFFRADLLRRLREAGADTVEDIAFRVGWPDSVPDRGDGRPEAPAAQPAPEPAPEERATAERLRALAGDDPLAAQLARLYLAAAARRRRLAGSGGPPPRTVS
jgi:hypothetical protein